MMNTDVRKTGETEFVGKIIYFVFYFTSEDSWGTD